MSLQTHPYHLLKEDKMLLCLKGKKPCHLPPLVNYDLHLYLYLMSFFSYNETHIL